jgi:hypothetical protein
MTLLRWLRAEAARHELLTVAAAIAFCAWLGLNLDAIAAAIVRVL